MKKSLKKASLSLSINAVVILVLAIAMLGLGLGFTKKMFSRFGDTLEIPEPELASSESDPIVLNSDQITIKKNKATTIPVEFYNVGGTGRVYPFLKCSSDCNAEPRYIGIPLTVAQGGEGRYRLALKAGFLGDKDQVICTLYFMKDTDTQGLKPCTSTVGDAGEPVLESKQITIIQMG